MLWTFWVLLCLICMVYTSYKDSAPLLHLPLYIEVSVWVQLSNKWKVLISFPLEFPSTLHCIVSWERMGTEVFGGTPGAIWYQEWRERRFYGMSKSSGLDQSPPNRFIEYFSGWVMLAEVFGGTPVVIWYKTTENQHYTLSSLKVHENQVFSLWVYINCIWLLHSFSLSKWDHIYNPPFPGHLPSNLSRKKVTTNVSRDIGKNGSSPLPWSNLFSSPTNKSQIDHSGKKGQLKNYGKLLNAKCDKRWNMRKEYQRKGVNMPSL